jgi:hypothetical protein
MYYKRINTEAQKMLRGGGGAELKGEVQNLRFVEFFYIAREVAIVEERGLYANASPFRK